MSQPISTYNGAAKISDLTLTGKINGIKRYVAILSQSSSNAPVAVVLENSLGGSPVWSYASAGTYLLTLSGAFPNTKTAVFTSGGTTNVLSNGDIIYTLQGGPNTVQLLSAQSGILSDDIIQATSIEIVVYP